MERRLEDSEPKEGIELFSLSHHHPDNLSYIFTRGSDYFTCEDGYNRNLMPDNHNVLLVDGLYTDAVDVNDAYMSSVRQRLVAGEPFCPEQYAGRVTKFQTEGSLVLYRGETAGVYPAKQEMQEVSRALITDGLRFWVFVDLLRSTQSHTYSLILQYGPKGAVGWANGRIPADGRRTVLPGLFGPACLPKAVSAAGGERHDHPGAGQKMPDRDPDPGNLLFCAGKRTSLF